MAKLSVLGLTLASNITGKEMGATDHKKVMVGDVEILEKNKKRNEEKDKNTTVVENLTEKADVALPEQDIDSSLVRAGDTSSEEDGMIV